MSSLRARVLASVLALAAVGLIAVGAVTYAEQRSFLYSRVDQQARSAVDAALAGARQRRPATAGRRPGRRTAAAAPAGGPATTADRCSRPAPTASAAPPPAW